MLQIQLFRTDKERIIAGLEKKNFKDLQIVDEIIALDEEKETSNNKVNHWQPPPTLFPKASAN